MREIKLCIFWDLAVGHWIAIFKKDKKPSGNQPMAMWNPPLQALMGKSSTMWILHCHVKDCREGERLLPLLRALGVSVFFRMFLRVSFFSGLDVSRQMHLIAVVSWFHVLEVACRTSCWCCLDGRMVVGVLTKWYVANKMRTCCAACLPCVMVAGVGGLGGLITFNVCYTNDWLVVGPPLWKIWKSIGMIRNPILMGK